MPKYAAALICLLLLVFAASIGTARPFGVAPQPATGGAEQPPIGQEQLPTVTLGVVSDGPYARRGGLLIELVRQEIEALAALDFRLEIPAEKQIEGNWTVEGIERALDQLLADPEVDLVLAMGFIGSHIAAQRRDLPKPVVAPMILDEDLQRLPRTDGGSGVSNLNYIVARRTEDVVIYREIAPFRRLGILIDAAFVEAVPDLGDRARAQLAEIGIEPYVTPVTSSAADALAALQPALDAVVVLPLYRLSSREFDRLVEGLIEQRLPSISWIGEFEVRLGIMEGRVTEDFVQRIARRIALNVQRILLGDDPAEVPIDYPANVRLMINMATARAVGVSPSFAVLTEAELIDDVVPEARPLSLPRAVQEAIDANLDLRVQEQIVLAGLQDAELARSDRRPQVVGNLTLDFVDKDLAESSLGIIPQRSFGGGISLRQVIYSEDFWANVDVQDSVQRAREYDRDTLRLDITFESAVAYLEVLRAKTFERIQRENLIFTRSNLETAQLRVDVGTARTREVHRWQNKIARDRQGVVDAGAIRALAEIALNRLLNRPLDERFAPEEADLDEPSLVSSDERLIEQIDDPRSFAIFEQFMAFEAIQNAPELQAFNELIAAQMRELTRAERSFWLPTFDAQAGIDGFFATGGAGSEPPPGSDFTFSRNDFNWFVGFNATYPFWAGGSRSAEKTRASEDLAGLEFDRQATAERIDQRVRSAMYELQASYVNIGLARDGADAARRNYELVTTEYAQGIATILDLLDAQTTALIARQAEADAVYQFLIDLMKVERGVARFDFFSTQQEIDRFFDRLEAYRQQVSGPAPQG